MQSRLLEMAAGLLEERGGRENERRVMEVRKIL